MSKVDEILGCALNERVEAHERSGRYFLGSFGINIRNCNVKRKASKKGARTIRSKRLMAKQVEGRKSPKTSTNESLSASDHGCNRNP